MFSNTVANTFVLLCTQNHFWESSSVGVGLHFTDSVSINCKFCFWVSPIALWY